LEKIGIIHLYTLGFRGDDLVSFRLKLNNPSKIAELQELEHWKTKFEIAGGATENFFSRRWIAQNIFDLSEEEFVRNQREMFHDRKFEAELLAVAENMGDESEGFGAPSDEGGLELDAGIGLEDLEAPEETETEEAPPEEEGGPLLAAPAKRDDRDRKYTEKSLSNKSKGKRYVPKSKRGGDGRNGRPQNFLGIAVPKPKDITPGFSDMKSLSRGLYEGKQTIYTSEESLLFESNSEIRNLISELEKSEIKINENEAQ